MKTILTVLLLFFSGIVSAQEILVLKVYDGRARVKGANHDLGPGDKLKIGDRIQYSGKNCEIRGQATSGDIVHLSPGHDDLAGLKKDSPILALLKSYFPSRHQEILGTKGADVSGSVPDLSHYFDPYKKSQLLVIDALDIPLFKTFANNGKSFFVEFGIDSVKHHKNLKTVADIHDDNIVDLRIDTGIATINHQQLDYRKITGLSLWCLDPTTKVAEQVVELNVRIVNFSEVSDAVRLLAQNNRAENCGDIDCRLRAICNYLYSFYGTVDLDTLKIKLNHEGYHF